ncbi:hypothetical protein [Dysgonomonas sp. ZJ709]|uniref:hypothetical protein n=1 Tax=Dysgonomonas sp. ZJ709 TaxID=2709797 RepID=UPI0013EB4EAA|nr:hypothetical protein [Dysgonomonas sp. ZJ709]
MALIVNNTAYSGEVLERLLVRATTGNELVDGGHVRVQPGIKKKFTLPRLRTGEMLQRRVEMPGRTDSKGNFEYDEKYLEPQDLMAYTEFNPRVFENIWKPFQPDGELVFRELPSDVQDQLLAEMAKVIQFELGDLYLNGVKGAGAKDFFDGILTRIVADSAVIKPAATELTMETMLPALRTIKTSIPKALRNSRKLKIFMSIEDFDIYDAILTDKPFKGVDYANMNSGRYKGYPIVALADMPKDVIFVAEGTSGIDSNLWVGVDYAEDSANVIKIDRVAPNGELFFFKMLMKADTNTVYGEDIVLWDGRGIPAPAIEPAGFMAANAMLTDVLESDNSLYGLQPIEGFEGLYANESMMNMLAEFLKGSKETPVATQQTEKVATQTKKATPVKTVAKAKVVPAVEKTETIEDQSALTGDENNAPEQ